MIRRPPRSTRTDTLFPYTTLFRSDLARTIRIPKLGIDASVVSVGLTPDGAVDTPRNIWEAAWYNGSAKPGALGQSFINGHASSTDGALFGRLEELAAGDEIQIVKGDGSVVNYRVAEVFIVDRHDVDMSSMLRPYGDASRGLGLLTCDGDWIPSE